MNDQELRDYIAICELKSRYCRLLDTKAWDEWAELFTEDLVLDTSAPAARRRSPDATPHSPASAR